MVRPSRRVRQFLPRRDAETGVDNGSDGIDWDDGTYTGSGGSLSVAEDGTPVVATATSINAGHGIDVTDETGGVAGLSVDESELDLNDTSLVTVNPTGSTETVDVSVARTYDLTLDDDCTITLTGAVTDEAWWVTVLLRQDGTGGWTVTWPGSVTWLGGVAPTLQTDPGALDVVTLVTLDGGTVWLGAAGDSSVNAHLSDALDAHDASAISVLDAGGHYAGTDVEAALQEIGTDLASLALVGGEDSSLSIVAATGTTETLDVTNARAYDLTLDDNVTITLTGPSAAEKHELTVLLRQDGTGSHTVTWPAGVHWVGGSAPTLNTSPYDVNIVRLITTSAGAEWLGIHDGAIALTATPHVSAVRYWPMLALTSS